MLKNILILTKKLEVIMKSYTKRVSAIIMALAFAIGLLSLGVGKGLNADAASTDSGYKFFYNQLSNDARAEKFYHAFEALEESGQFKNGKVEYDLVKNEVLSKEEVIRYVDLNDVKIPKSYGSGRDAYIMDHPDLFYVDVFGTSISAGQQGNDYVAFLDSSRAASLYLGNINSQQSVNAAIASYEENISKIVSAAKAAGGTKEQIEFVNKYIAEHTEYSFGTTIKDGKNVALPEADYIDTAYGSIVNGKAICGGYAKGFKAVMDRLGIPCVCVQGYCLSSATSTFQPHMWNYVELEGQWYAVDVTWNDTSNKLNEWLLVGGQKIQDTHIEDGIISSAGYNLNYPAIKPYPYGVDTDDNGMTIEGTYKEVEGTSGKVLDLSVSFENKSVQQLEKEGKYVSFRVSYSSEREIEWSPWMNCIAASDMFPSMFKFNEDSLECRLYAHTSYIQFALIDYAADISLGATYPDKPEYGDNAGKECYYIYDSNKLNDSHFIGAISTPYHNNGFGSYIPAPGASTTSPANTGALPVDKTYTITIKYNENLELVDGKTTDDITMELYTSRGNDTIKDHAIISDLVWDGKNTLTFTFTPSKMYIHDSAVYSFYPENLVGIKSKKVPEPVDYKFKGKSVVCSRIFNDGRLYMNVFGAPQMLDTSDLSVSDFKDENGNYYAASQRSQLLLVANKPSKAQEEKMDEVLKQETPIKDEDIVSSATYEISLQICGVVRKVPNGSYMQVAFGFPEGYSPDDEGTTFKIYHYKHDNAGNITGVEEIPAIITQYGLIAQVKSFSPFTIVQIKNTSAAVDKNQNKNVYATVNGIGGSISTQNAEGKSGIVEVTGETISFDITADTGYQIANVMLNGKSLDASRFKDGKLVLTKTELENSNMLEVSFVTQESAKSYEDRGITISTIDTASETPIEKWTVTFDSDGGSSVEAISNIENGNKIAKPADPTKEGYTFNAWVKADGTAWNFDVDTVTENTTLKATWNKIATKTNDSVGIIIGCVIGGIVVVGAVVGTVFVLKKKRSKDN